jgi:hypothetical protein
VDISLNFLVDSDDRPIGTHKPPPGDLKPVARKCLKLHRLANPGMGVHGAVTVFFGSVHSASVDVSIHSALTGVRPLVDESCEGKLRHPQKTTPPLPVHLLCTEVFS